MVLTLLAVSVSNDDVIDDQRVWSIKECANVFKGTIAELAEQLAKEGDGGMLVWDKVGAHKEAGDECSKCIPAQKCEA